MGQLRRLPRDMPRQGRKTGDARRECCLRLLPRKRATLTLPSVRTFCRTAHGPFLPGCGRHDHLPARKKPSGALFSGHIGAWAFFRPSAAPCRSPAGRLFSFPLRPRILVLHPPRTAPYLPACTALSICRGAMTSSVRHDAGPCRRVAGGHNKPRPMDSPCISSAPASRNAPCTEKGRASS